MKTMRDTLLVVFVSFILIARLTRCGAATILDDRDKETQELEELVRKEVYTSLQFLSEDDGDDVDPQSYNIGQQSRPTYSDASGNGNRNAGQRYANYQYNAPNQETRIGDNSKASRSINVMPPSAASVMNTREPGGYTATVTLPSLSGGRLLSGGGGSSGGYSGSINGGGSSGGYSGGVNGDGYSSGGGHTGGGYSGSGGYTGDGMFSGGRWRPSGLIRRGMHRLNRLGNGFGDGNTRLGYGLGGGAGGLSGGMGSQGVNFGWGGSSGGGAGGAGGGYYDKGSDGSISLSGNGRQGYYGNGRYGLQGDYGGSGVGGSWSTSGNGLNDYYNLRYGSPNSSGGGSATISLDGASNRRGSGHYTQSSPKDSASGTVSTTGRENPVQYELMFVKDQPDSSNNDRIQAVLNQHSDAKLPATSEASRDASDGGGYRVNLSGSGRPRADSMYRVVVVNNDSAGNGSGRLGGSLSTSGSAPGGSGSTSWSVSSNGSTEPGSGSSRNGFQMTTPVTIPPTTLVGSVLSSVQGAVTGDQTRSLGAGSDSSGGTIIKLVKTS